MKLLFSPSSLLSVEDTGLLPRFMKCRDMARSSSWASTAEPAGDRDGDITGGGGREQREGVAQRCQALPSIPPPRPAPGGASPIKPI